MSQVISTQPSPSTELLPAPRFDAESGKIVIATPIEGGYLEFDPTSRFLTDEHLAILSPLGITKEFAAAHVVAFLNDCRSRGFDPWAREAYLMKYPGDKYVHHIGIAGFRRHAEETRQFEGRDPVLYYDAAGATSRVWLKPDEVPYAAEITVYRKARRPETRVALYDEFCPLMDEYVADPAGGKDDRGRPKRKKTGRRVPVPMWRTGKEGGMVTVMLGKCAEAMAMRAAFPDRFGGWYLEEELHGAAAEATRDVEDLDERQARRREAYRAATGKPANDVDGDEIGAQVVDQDAAAPAGDVASGGRESADDVDQDAATMTEDQVRALLLAELDAQSAIVGRTPGWLVKRWAAARNVEPSAFPTAPIGEVAAHVRRLREYVAGELRKQGRPEMADHYTHRAPLVGDLVALFGGDPTDPAGDLVDQGAEVAA